MPLAFGPRLEISERKLLLRSGDTLLIVASLLGALLGWSMLARRAFDVALLETQLYWIVPILVGWLVWL
ncbi:MAG TPA: sugar transferase, partial [Roseiflexaceae bacterium]|nr:sugar transferase [Roseiflexaceae bacterium]